MTRTQSLTAHTRQQGGRTKTVGKQRVRVSRALSKTDKRKAKRKQVVRLFAESTRVFKEIQNG